MAPPQTDSARRLAPRDVEHLAFEGGGGKGIAFIGALAALDALKIRPVTSNGGAVRSLSGASAGSITLFLYAMKMTPHELIDIQLAEGVFAKFFESPQLNLIRTVTARGFESNHPMVRFVGRDRRALLVDMQQRNQRFNTLLDFPAGELPDRFSGVRDVFQSRSSDLFQKFLLARLRGFGDSRPELRPMISALTRSHSAFLDYCYCLFFDLGLFSGFAVRDFLKGHLTSYVVRSLGNPHPDSRAIDRLSVEHFRFITGLNVAFSAVNASTGRGHYFRGTPTSKGMPSTPEFPVLDAVAISSSYPLVFKPYVVAGRADVPNGFWLDGGVQNNYPLHAFDDGPDKPLARGMLGLRLESAAEPFRLLHDVGQYLDTSLFGFLMSFISDLVDTAMFPTEGGQVRTAQERAQTIEIVIPSSMLSTLDFSPRRENASRAILAGFDAVATYFVPGFAADSPAVIGPPSTVPQAWDQELHKARRNLRTKLGVA